MSTHQQKKWLIITGFDKDTDRRTLLTELRKIGQTERLYLDPNGNFAKVLFADNQTVQKAFSELNNSTLNWKVKFDNQKNLDTSNNMAYYGDYDDEDFSENYDYCNIHGDPLVVLQADSGDLYINLEDIKKTGFSIFRKDRFNSALVDNRQIEKEFDLHLLSEAKNYILRNRAVSIDEEQILRTIERCKNRLLGESAKSSNNTFGSRRTIEHSSQNITITSDVDPQPHESKSPRQGAQEPKLPMMSQNVHHRPPKTLPNNFIPTQSARISKGFNTNQNYQQGQKGRRENSRYNGFKEATSSTRNEDEFNTSGSSDNKSGFRNFRTDTDSSGRPQRSFREPRETISKINFEIGNTYDVVVSAKGEKENIIWVQDRTRTGDLEELAIKLNEAVENLENIDNPTQSQLVAAEFEGVWCRGRIMNVDPLMVHFLDYGNKSGVECVRALPDSLKTTPALASRMALCGKYEVKEDMPLKIKIKQKYDDGTYLISVLPNNKGENISRPSPANNTDTAKDSLVESWDSGQQQTEVPKKAFYNIPAPMTELQDGDKVMLVDVEDNKFIVRTKECALKSKAITDYIKNLDKPSLTLTGVKVGQLVLSSRDGFVGLFRAVVSKLENDLIAKVKYVDFPGEDDLTIKSLRNVDEFLSSEPATILMTPEFKGLEAMNVETSEYVSTLCQNKEKLTVVLSKGKFDLKKNDDTLLSEILDDLKNPKPAPEKVPVKSPAPKKEVIEIETVPEPTPVPASTEKILYDEMDWIKIDPGQHTLMCYNLQDLDDITFLSSCDEVIRYLETITSVNPTDQDPYEPEECEMCLVLFKGPDDDEASWYRAVVISVEDNGYSVSLVDFGNMEVIDSKNIRKFPAYLKDIPILGISCELVGFPKKPEILDRLKELLSEGTQAEVVIKGLEGLKYQIELPEIFKKLKAEKLF